MGDSIERALEETVPILRAAQRAKLLSSEETTDVVRRRRDHEYAVAARNASRSDFLKYAAFERELASVLKKRAEKKKLKKQKAQLVIGKSAARVNLVYSRAVKKFNADAELWLHYARHCVRTGSNKAAGKVFAKALAYRGDSEDVWLAAVAFHFDTCGDTRGARALAQRALRALPDSFNMWKEYFRLELCFLAKLISRRIAMGLPVSGTVQRVENTGNQGETKQSLVVDEDKSELSSDVDVEMAAIGDGDVPDATRRKTTVRAEGDPSMGNLRTDATVPTDGAVSKSAEGPSAGSRGELSFWDGGVPMAVYINACKKVSFTAKYRADFWDIAAATPYAPAKFLEALSSALVESCPDCIVSCFIKLRLDWDLSHSQFREELARGDTKNENEDDELLRELEQKRESLAKSAMKVFSRMEKLVLDCKWESLDEASRLAILSCIENFVSVAKNINKSESLHTQARQLMSQLKSGKLPLAISLVDGDVVPEEDSASNPKAWSVEHLANMLVSKKCPLSREVYDIFKARILVPFRDAHQERALCAWISVESNLNRLHEICDALQSLPPVTSESLKAAVGSQVKIRERMKRQGTWTPEDSEQMIVQTRRLFKMATGLVTANKDVDLWLDYVDFERRITRDAKQATLASWKAMKVLDQRNGALFTERQTLRNLVQ